jgi:hypothetical protein
MAHEGGTFKVNRGARVVCLPLTLRKLSEWPPEVAIQELMMPEI